jgi:hypothetical protein
MIREIMSGNNIDVTTSPILNLLMKNNPGVDLEEEKFEEEFIEFKSQVGEICKISKHDKIGRDGSGKYYIFASSMFQKLTRLIYRENREWTFKYLDEDFTKFMHLLDKIIAKYNLKYTLSMKKIIERITEFIDSIMPGLYNLKKTYPQESNIVAKIDSIIVTLIDFKDSTRQSTNLNIVSNVFRQRAFSE